MRSLLSPVHRLVWSDARRRALNLRRRLFLIHAADEQRPITASQRPKLSLNLSPARRN